MKFSITDKDKERANAVIEAVRNLSWKMWVTTDSFDGELTVWKRKGSGCSVAVAKLECKKKLSH